MSRAYCLTCNEPVHETPNGTCPLGHPVTTHDHGPEPWVGFAGDEDHASAGTATPARVPLQRLDVEGRPVVPAGRTNGAANGHANGHGSALGGGQGHTDPFPSAFGHRSSFAASDEPAAPPTERAPATGAAADDLAALLADALSGDAASPEAPEEASTGPIDAPGPDTDLPASPGTGSGDEPEASWDDGPGSADWDDLTTLAAELQLGDSPRDDGPTAATSAAPADLDQDAIDAASIDDLLAELTGGLAAEHEPDPAPPATTTPADEPAAPPRPTWDPPASASPPPPPPPSPETAVPPPPASPGAAPEPVDDADAAWEDVASAPPAPEPVDLWAEPTPEPADPVATETSVDLTNFTARGRRVGDAGPGRPKKKRGRKR